MKRCAHGRLGKHLALATDPHLRAQLIGSKKGGF